jgi:hypothetical protein
LRKELGAQQYSLRGTPKRRDEEAGLPTAKKILAVMAVNFDEEAGNQGQRGPADLQKSPRNGGFSSAALLAN